MNALRSVALVAVLTGLPLATAARLVYGDSAGSPAHYCVIDASNGIRTGLEGIVVNGACRPARAVTTTRTGTKSASVTRTVECDAGISCGPDIPRCFVKVVGEPDRPGGTAYAYQQFDPKTRTWITLSIWCPSTQSATAPPVVTAAAIHEQVLRLLPTAAIATTGAHTLVNIQTILWADTSATQYLGPVDIVGQTVHLRLDFDHARWDYGDGSTGSAPTPGKAYDNDADPCATKQCPDYGGHTYTTTGTKTIRLTVYWRASYSLDGTAYLPVDDQPIGGPTTTHPIIVRQARAVLVPNP
jgi:hypothetical protein